MSTRKTEERDIGALRVTSIQLPAMLGSRLRVRLLKLITPALAAFRGKVSSVDDVSKMDVAELAPALVAVANQLDDAAHDALVLQLLVCTSVVRDDGRGSPIKFDLTSKQLIDTAFDGDVDAMWATARFAIEVNLGSFFKASAGGDPQVPAPSS